MSIVQNALKKHAPLQAGEHAFTITTDTIVTVKRGDLMKVGFDVQAGGKTAHIELAYDGSPSGVVAQQLSLIDKWAKLLHADLSEKRIGDDWRRVPYALALAAKDKVVIGVFTQTAGKTGGVFINLTDVRVEEAEYDDASYESDETFEDDADAV